MKSLTKSSARHAVDYRNVSIRMSQNQQNIIRREAKRRGLRIRDLIARSVKFYIQHGEDTTNGK